jgi:two-component system, NtrC family, response regulator AlgB
MCLPSCILVQPCSHDLAFRKAIGLRFNSGRSFPRPRALVRNLLSSHGGSVVPMAKTLLPQQVDLVQQRVPPLLSLRHEHQPPSNTPEPPPLWESANAEMARAIASARQVAAFDVPILLTGENGTGKKVLAAAIHGWSPRSAGPFVAVARAALAEHRLEGGLVAYAEDAWKDRYGWLDAANGGTLFFEEAGDLPSAVQAKLIRFLDGHRLEQVAGDKTANTGVRLITASDHDLEMDVRAGRFRQDLFFRLNVVGIHLPPLRERPEDLPKLTDQMLAILCTRHRRDAVRLTPEVQRVFARYRWPGNIRELVSVLERVVVLSRGEAVTTEDLPERLLVPPLEATGALPSQPLSLNALERHHVALAIRESATLQEAATRLGIHPTTLWRKRKRYGLT